MNTVIICLAKIFISFVFQLETRSHQQKSHVWQFREVLDKLLDIVTSSVKQALCLEKVTHSPELVFNCCHLLVRVVAELASQASGIDVSNIICILGCSFCLKNNLWMVLKKYQSKKIIIS